MSGCVLVVPMGTSGAAGEGPSSAALQEMPSRNGR